jgi:protein TonB
LPWAIENGGNNIAVFTLLLWSMVSGVGALGFLLRYERPRLARASEPAIVAQQLQVELTPDKIPPRDPQPQPDKPAEPTVPDSLVQPAIFQPIAVAIPGPAIAFALPVERPKRIVDVKRAEYSVSPATNAPAGQAGPPSAQPLVFGQGEGKQPSPEYPNTAKRLGQEGTVLVRISVGEDGHVLEAHAKIASPWPLLNEAALRTVRERWRFSKGSSRIYEVPIRFEITR